MRYALLGKTGSGKTLFSLVLVSLLIPMDSVGWECWWCDTKDYAPDLDELHRWGFRERGTKAASLTPRKLILLRGTDAEVVEAAQAVAREAMERTAVLLVFDEWAHVVVSTQRAGQGIERAQKSGRGKIGLLGGVQEPVLTPRVLFSQASVLALFNLTHRGDIEIAQKLCPYYAPNWPKEDEDPLPDPHGFWLKWLDGHSGDGRWAYWPSVQEWRASVRT
jgi:hypothetical protein